MGEERAGAQGLKGTHYSPEPASLSFQGNLTEGGEGSTGPLSLDSDLPSKGWRLSPELTLSSQRNRLRTRWTRERLRPGLGTSSPPS